MSSCPPSGLPCFAIAGVISSSLSDSEEDVEEEEDEEDDDDDEEDKVPVLTSPRS